MWAIGKAGEEVLHKVVICVKFFQLAVLGRSGGRRVDIVVIQIHGFQRVNAAELDDGDQFVV